jgi:hypothetical protein
MTIARGVASSGGRSKSLIGACAFVFSMIGCSEPLGPEQDDLAEAMSRWEDAGLQDYVFEFQRLCFCGGDTIRRVRIVVRSGAVTAATYVDDGPPVSGGLEDFPTIDALFEEIQDAIDREAHELTASYHPALGYPTAVSIDYIENAVDEEMAFNVYSLASPGTARRDSPLPLATAANYSPPPSRSAPLVSFTRPRCPTYSSRTAARTTPSRRRWPRTSAS